MQPSLPLARNGRRVLLVEDDAEVSAATTSMLERLGYMVASAESVPQALVLIDDEFLPDVLVTDFHLATPENGLDCIALVRQCLGRADLPAILVTGNLQITEQQVREARHAMLLNKPVRSKKLQEALDSFLEGS